MPTLNDVLAGSQAQAVQVQQIIDALKGTPNKGVPVALVSLNDPNNYALTVQNDDPVNSRALSVLKADGTTLISADATGVTLGAPINVPAGALSGTQLANASVSNAKLGSDTARANLLVNGGFEIWQRGNGPFTTNAAYSADRWQNTIIGTDTLSVSKDTTHTDAASTACAACTFALGSGAGATQLFQQLTYTDYTQVAGRTMSLSVRVRTSTATAVRIALYNGAAWVYSAYHSGGGAYETLTVTGSMPATGQGYLGVNFSASCTAYLDNAMLVVGSQYADYAPMHPADDLARCLRYYETSLLGSNGYLASGQAYSTTQGVELFYFAAKKAISPTITFSPASTFASTGSAFQINQCTSVSANSIGAGASSVLGIGTTVASGLIAGNATTLIVNTGQNASISAEANP